MKSRLMGAMLWASVLGFLALVLLLLALGIATIWQAF